MQRRELVKGLALLTLAACTATEVRSADPETPSPSDTPAPPPMGAAPSSSGPALGAGTPSPSPSPSPTPPAAATETPSPTPSATATSHDHPEPPAATETPGPTAVPTEQGAVVIQEICRESLPLPAAREDARTHTIAGLMLHHTAVASSSASQAPGRLRGHARYHRDQGWPDIAYHVGVDLDGNVYELRDPATPGDTFTAYDPAGWFLVVAEGDFNSTTPTPQLLESVSRVFAWASTRFGVPVDTLAGHRDAASTSCPGDQLYGALGSIRDRANALVNTGGVTLQVLCGSEGDARVAEIESGRG